MYALSRVNLRPLLLSGVLFFVTLATPATGSGQMFARRSQPDRTITAPERTAVIDATLQALEEKYVFPERATEMTNAIHKRQAEHQYDSITSAKKFAELLTNHLRDVCHDKHLRVLYNNETLPVRKPDEQPSAQEREQFRQRAASQNFGFEKVERLPGNLGYLDLRGFAPPALAAETAIAAMAFLANTDALIIDLRKNGGGDPAMVALLCSYLFDDSDPVHLNDLYNRAEASTHQWWTLPYVPGKRYPGKEVYVLTSHNTFSAAEECTYNLKNLKRATIVGETTGGGAHPVEGQRLSDHFMLIVPVARAISPITKTNWEGTGVKPDVEVPADQALKTAQLLALKKLAEKSPHDDLTSDRLAVIRALEKDQGKAVTRKDEKPSKP